MNCKLRRLVRVVASLNTLVVSCWWMGRSEFVVSLSDWRGLVYDNLALLAGMAAAISITLMCLKPNASVCGSPLGASTQDSFVGPKS